MTGSGTRIETAAQSTDDLAEPDSSGWACPAVDRQLLLAGVDLLVTLAAAASLVMLVQADRDIRYRVAGVGLAAAGLLYAGTALVRHKRLGSAVLGVVAAGFGAEFIAAGQQQQRSVAIATGISFAAAGLIFLVRIIRGRDGRRRWMLGVLLIPAGVGVLLLPGVFLDLTLWVSAVIVGLSGVLRFGHILGLVTIPDSDTRPLLIAWIDAKSRVVQDRAGIREQVLFEGPDTFARIARFALMMLFASLISAMGVLTDSTAVVIGAMLIAPLISPMMGMGLSLAMGWPRRLARSTLIVLTGIGIAVGTGAFLAAVLDLSLDLSANSQITSRSSPTVADLVIAVGAGAAGAYALSRKDVSSSLPGVAIAIALVPPLSVVGIAAERGDGAQAAGTLLLFLTNLVSILLVGGIVFVLTGVAPLSHASRNRERVQVAVAAVVTLGVLVVSALIINGRSITEDSLATDNARRTVASWLGSGTGFTVITLTVKRDRVSVVLAGPGDPPSSQRLAADLAHDLHRLVNLDLQWIPRQQRLVRAVPG